MVGEKSEGGGGGGEGGSKGEIEKKVEGVKMMGGERNREKSRGIEDEVEGMRVLKIIDVCYFFFQAEDGIRD